MNVTLEDSIMGFAIVASGWLIGLLLAILTTAAYRYIVGGGP